MPVSLAYLRPFAVTALVAAAALAPTGAQAGFFDQLFGGGTVEPTRPSYSYEPQQQAMPDLGAPLPREHKKKLVMREAAPVRQKTTALMLDKTLHPGDAVMMKDGMHIYSGPESAKHTDRQFVPIDLSRSIPSKTRAALVAMDTTRNDPLKKGTIPDTIASGRSAAVAAPISKGIRITDARGVSLRYVGP